MESKSIVSCGTIFEERTAYDEEGRVLGSAQYDFDETDEVEDEADVIANTSTDRDDWPSEDNVTSFTLTDYNTRGQVESSTDAFGNTTTNFYDTRGNVVETRTPTKDEFGDPQVLITRTAYDDNGRATHSTDPFILGQAGDIRGTRTFYDALGRVIATERLEHLLITIADDEDYPATGIKTATVTTQTSFTTPVVSETFYDSSGRVDHTIDASDARTDYYYDAAGRQVAVLSPVVELEDGNDARLLTVYVYDAAGRQTEVASALKVGDTITDWDAHPADAALFDSEEAYGVHTDVDSTAAQTTRFIYDALGRIIRTTQVGDPTSGDDDVRTETLYDALGRRVAEIDPMGRRTDYGYDDAGRLLSVTLPQVLNPDTELMERPIYEYAYDEFGNQETITDPNEHTTTFTYDHLGRPISRVLPLGASTGVESQHYDDRPLSEVTTLEASTALGQLAYAVGFEGHVTQYLYDNTATGGGRLVEKSYYDADDLTGVTITVGMTPAQITAALSSITPVRTLTYSYDAFGRQVEVDDDGHGVTAYTYDVEGRTTRITSPQGVMNYRYNALGQMERTWTGDTTASDDSGTPGTENVYTYDSLGRLKTVTQTWRGGSDITDETTTYEYDLVGNLDMQVTEWNDVVADYQYDALNRLEMLTHYYDENGNRTFDGIDEERANFQYQYQLDGARTQVIETDDLGDETTIDWEYDNLGRLVSETSESDNNDRDYVDEFTYDLASNRLTRVHTSPSEEYEVEYTYDANDRLLNEVKDYTTGGTDTNTVYSYGPADAHTTQTGKTVKTGTTVGSGTLVSSATYHYDARGRMVTVEIDSDGDTNIDSTVTYEYDDNGLRVTESSGGTTRTYLFDTQNHTGYSKPVEEWVDSGGGPALDKTYTLGHMIIAQHDDTNGTLSFVQDGHGNTRALLDEMAGIVQRLAYDAFGVVLEGDGLTSAVNVLTAWLGPDGAYAVLTELTYHLERWRRGHVFMQFDPRETNVPVAVHKYLYAHANPVMGIDPSGMFRLDVTVITIATIAAVGSLLAGGYQAVRNYATGRPILDGVKGASLFGAAAAPIAVKIPVVGGVIAFCRWCNCLRSHSRRPKRKRRGLRRSRGVTRPEGRCY